jgi:hypothetical protein
MSHFAHVQNGIVTEVLVIEQDVLNTGAWGNPSEFVQTSFNTLLGDYKLGSDITTKLALKSSGTKADRDARNRKNFAGVGYIYDAKRDAFYEPQPYKSWVLDELTCLWQAPIPYPEAPTTSPELWHRPTYKWDEQSQNWVKV